MLITACEVSNTTSYIVRASDPANLATTWAALRSPSKLEAARHDCASQVVSVVTPPVVTATEFSTILSTSITVVDEVVDSTIAETTTLVVSQTATVTNSITKTVTVPLGAALAPTKRAEIPMPAFPSYASACSNVQRYASACSCISATPATTTLDASTTTTVVPTTIWTTETQTSVSTNDVHVTASASTTVTAATVTVDTVVATRTASPFYMSLSDQYGNFYIANRPTSEYLEVTDNPARAIMFSLLDDGTLWIGDRKIMRTTVDSLEYARAIQAKRQGLDMYSSLICSVSSGSNLNCAVPGTTANAWATKIQLWNGSTLVRFTNAGLAISSPQHYSAATAPPAVYYPMFSILANSCLVDQHCASGTTCRSGKCV
jgi:hypothetical protein